ncbi:MAG: Uncharacterised protein [Prochlorococcus marinus str. MIT 9313]|nr:MAG: Uncharacterised protein [Prochlorococcus marinus str. MIT 9313]
MAQHLVGPQNLLLTISINFSPPETGGFFMADLHRFVWMGQWLSLHYRLCPLLRTSRPWLAEPQ